MRIALFDGILETHLHSSLERALVRRGHEVFATGKIGHGFRFPHPVAERLNLERAVSETIAFAPEWVFVFRPASLPPHLLARLRDRGIKTVAWFSDDPVLFDLSYGPIVEQYDRVLHCGNEAVLGFYERFFGRPTGVNFPFWTDHEAFPRVWRSEAEESRAMFLGNVQDAVRRRRYFDLARFGDDIRIHGKTGSDYWKRAAGYLDSDAEVVVAGARTTWAINIPQFFKDHQGLETWFPGLDRLGFFEYPSRVVQYMAMGIPTVSIIPSAPAFETYPEMLVVEDVEAAIDVVRGHSWSEPELRELSDRVTRRFRRHFSADARAQALEAFLSDDDSWQDLDAAERARWFTRFDGERSGLAPTADPERHEDASYIHAPSAPSERRVVVVTDRPPQPTDRAAVLVDSLKALGRAVTIVTATDEHRALDTVVSARDASDAIVLVCSNRLKLSGQYSRQLSDVRSTSVLVLDGQFEVNRASAAMTRNFDVLAFSDPLTLSRFRDAGFERAISLPHVIAPTFVEAVAKQRPAARASLRLSASANVEEAMSPGFSVDLADAGIALESWESLRELPLAELARAVTSETAFISPAGTRSKPVFDSLFHHAWFAAEHVFLPRLNDLTEYPHLADTSVLIGDPGELGRKSWRLLHSPRWSRTLRDASTKWRSRFVGTDAVRDFLHRVERQPAIDHAQLSSNTGLLDQGSALTTSLWALAGDARALKIRIAARERYFAEPQLEVRVRAEGKHVWSARVGTGTSFAVAIRDSVDPRSVEVQVRYTGRSRNVSVAESHRIRITSSATDAPQLPRVRSGSDVTVVEIVQPGA
ncbi:hypothetical protein SAMN04489719_2126 [Agrococcus carbonis]|uniref:Glycosyl transferases group 1 n=2 Tax=Agrococcus carbonis TaxID=684552 RepID=A0A1H1RHP3_9MICO|nr:hypothetical protein SAMN04489719_2126 [Agrococcus carbonis]